MAEKIYDNNNNPVAFVATKAVAIDASDTALVGPGLLYVGTGGDVKVDLQGSGTAIVFKNVQDGTILPVLVKRVYVADTTADDFIILN